MYLTSKISHHTQKKHFSTTSLSVTILQTGYQMTQKKRSKRKKLMTPNTNYPTSSLSFTLLHLPLISPLLSSPKSYKNVGNRSKKAFFNYLPVSNTVTIRLPNITEIRAKKRQKMAKKLVKNKKITPEINPQSQCWSTLFSDRRIRLRRIDEGGSKILYLPEKRFFQIPSG